MRHHLHTAGVVSAFCLGLVPGLACGPLELPDLLADDRAADRSKSKGGDSNDDHCDRRGYVGEPQDSWIYPEQGFMWKYYASAEDPSDHLSVMLLSGADYPGGLSSVGSVTLTERDRDPYDCVTCISINAGCTADGSSCAAEFVAYQGTLELTVVSAATFNGTFTGELIEVLVPESPEASTREPEIWCLEGVQL